MLDRHALRYLMRTLHTYVHVFVQKCVLLTCVDTYSTYSTYVRTYILCIHTRYPLRVINAMICRPSGNCSSLHFPGISVFLIHSCHQSLACVCVDGCTGMGGCCRMFICRFMYVRMHIMCRFVRSTYVYTYSKCTVTYLRMYMCSLCMFVCIL